MSHLAELQAQVATLQAQLAALLPPSPPPLVSAPAEPEPPRPTPIYTLVGSPEMGRLHRNPRAVRQLTEAVALCRGAASPAREVPADWVPQLHRLASARASGSSWRAALAEVGLEAPSDLEVQARAVRLELDDLWSRLLPLVGMTLDGINSTAKITLTAFLKRALS